jgi:ribosomal protein L11 methyltransferase
MVESVMAWLEVHIQTNAKAADEIGDELSSLGAQALTMNDAGNQPIFEPALNKAPTLWPEITLVGLFDDEEDMNPVVAYLETQHTAGSINGFTITALADEDWERRCLDSFKPICFGKRLWACPSWLTPPEPDAVNVIIDPGLAFGTGTHSTTSLCLEWLDENIQTGEIVIDYGCGSGILAIAALKLGAHTVDAVDHDESALETTKENGALNHIPESQLKTYLPDAFRGQPADLMIANILAQPLITLAPTLANFVKSGGKILLSGILREQAEQVSAAYRPWFTMQAPVFKEEWTRLVGIRQ